MRTIVDYLSLWRKQTPDKVAYIFLQFDDEGNYQKREITCKELFENSKIYASKFIENGIKKGDCIVIVAEQSEKTLYAIYGAMLMGGIFILTPPALDNEKLKRIQTTIDASNAKYIVLNTEFMGEYLSEEVIQINVDQIDLTKTYSNNSTWKPIVFSENDIVCLQYTSGSTSQPKGVIFTHKNIMEAMMIEQEEYPTEDTDIYVNWLPFFHTMELTVGIFYSLYTNRQSINIQTKDVVEDPARWFEIVSDFHATMTLGPTSGYLSCINGLQEQKLNLSQLRYLLCSSEPVSKANMEYIYEKLKRFGLKRTALHAGLGMTEAMTMFTIASENLVTATINSVLLQHRKIEYCTEKNLASRIITSAGKVSRHLKVIIVDPITLKECDKDEIGEIWYQGDVVSPGYWKKEKETNEVFRATCNGHEGTFLRSGDLGFLKDGELFLTGRCKEMIIINGKNIFPVDVEQIIRTTIPTLQQNTIKVIVIQVFEKEHLLVFIEEDEPYSVCKEIAKDTCHAIAEYYHINAYDVIITKRGNLPRTDNGKVSINLIKELYKQRQIPYIYSMKDEEKEEFDKVFSDTEYKIVHIFNEILNVKCRSPKDDFYKMGGSSLTVLQLVKCIKRDFDVLITTEQVLEGATIEELESYIDKK